MNPSGRVIGIPSASEVGGNRQRGETATGVGSDQLVGLDERAPVWLEVGVVGGLGLVVYFGPQIYHVLKQSVNFVGSHMSRCIDSTLRITEPFNKRRRRGSLIRALVYLLPDCVFAPTPRIFIAGMNQRNPFSQLSSTNCQTTLFSAPSSGVTTQGIGNDVLVGFILGAETAESECTELPEDFDEGESLESDSDVSSNPEGWHQHLSSFPPFRPGANSTRFKCSTPTPMHPNTSYLQDTELLNDSLSTDCDDARSVNLDEIVNLKQEIEQLRQQMMILQQNQTNNFTYSESSLMMKNNCDDVNYLPPPPSHLLSGISSISTPPPPPLIPVISCGGGPPPPPPPPMPATVFQGSGPKLQITKSKNPGIPDPNAVVTMHDVLKGLGTVKLRPTAMRSPGGTPFKDKKNKNKDGFELEAALQKRFASMHSPAGSDDENTFMDKENDFDDSIFQPSADSPKRNLFSKRKSRSSNTLKPRNLYPQDEKNQLLSRKSNTNPAPFGPHLLKKRNPKTNSASSSVENKAE